MKMCSLRKFDLTRISVWLVLCLAIFSSVESASRKDVWVSHTIKRGENLTVIARKYKVKSNDIIAWNRIKSPDKIFVGQKLKIRKSVLNKQSQPSATFSEKIVNPVGRMNIIKGYRPYGEGRNYGIVAQVIGSSEVMAMAGGKVIKIGQLRGYGEYILIDHGKGWHTMYSHLSKLNVKRGQYVNAGEKIAIVENHKLFILMAFNGKPVNPVLYLNNNLIKT
ncbi:MAG: LysM peptidoglycan-binding domain-containing M23 family metallopeptidase [Leptospirales bacterium]